jgi:hypothetical protein
MVLIVWQTDTHSTFNYVLTIHFTLRALARDARSDWSRLCIDCSFSALKHRQYFTLWPASLWSNMKYLLCAEPLQLRAPADYVTWARAYEIVHSYERTKVRAREWAQSQEIWKHLNNQTTLSHTVVINSCCIKYHLHPWNIRQITWRWAYNSIRCYTKPKFETESLINVQINLW